MSATTGQNDNGEPAQRRTGEDFLPEWRLLYPTLSAMLADLECPVVFDLTARTPHIRALFQSSLDRWKQLGRPALAWPESAHQDLYPSGLRKPRPQISSVPRSS